MTPKNLSGRIGEAKAREYLEENGYRIICNNYKTKIAEIDIIALDADTLCFIEVKTRKNKAFGYASEAVDFSKRKKMALGAQCFLSSHPQFKNMRFDVVEVYGKVCDGGFAVEEINIIKNAFDV